MPHPMHRAPSRRRPPLALSTFTLCMLSAAPFAAAQTAAEAPTTLQEVQVRDAGDAAGGYQGAQRGTAATRTETPLIETPQAVRVVPRQFIDDLGATRLADTVDFVSGITRLNDFGGTWDNYAIRGFSNTDGGTLLNGFASSRGYGPQRDMATVERVEFLKGPAAALYGSSEPGGTVNVVTKKPQFTPSRTASLQVGGLGYRRASLDATGPLASNLAYRLNVAAEDGASRTGLADNRKSVLAPALTWTLGTGTVLQYEAEFIRIRTPLDRGIVQVNGNPGALPADRYLGDPSRSNLHVNGDTHQFTLDHELGPGWRTRLGLSHRETDLYGDAVDLNGTLRADGRTLTRRDSWRSLPARDTSVQAEVEGRLRTGGLGHTLLAGVESWRLSMGQDIRYSNLATQPFAIDIFQPVYGQAPGTLTPGFDTRDRQRATGLFVQDQLDLTDRWKLLLGARFDRFHQDYENRLAGTTQAQEHSAATPRAGLTYLLSDRASLYVSAGRSFRPNTGAGEDGGAFAPQKGKAFEAGAKWQSADQRLSGAVAVFDIRKTNVLTRSPTNANFSIAAGEVRSRGAEADLAGQLDAHWRLSANLAYTDTEVTRDNNPALLGKRLANIPRVAAGLFAIREDRLASGGRYGLGGGLVHVGERTGTATDTYRLPAYTTARATAYWQIDPRTRLTLDVHNLFDKTYYTASWGALTVLPGLGRQVVAGLQVQF
ncbi:TonB-dependent siderophore receptor [Acidovorax sp. NCPPB 4044]|uniref:TonB-dependent siderophore receptor n=1 Tax=Acidovorax sp. NCPPB 4044 TaxID=2940490 RepID=UPI0023031805|nr:TonB-dependent siderophore receptor [Acidovorax sp. NCPPB 4044]MDA8523137.1 TonB-dependent siderophore receptor [Acidovorax sp. NCPPB 4044]